MEQRVYYVPGPGGVEGLPTTLSMFFNTPLVMLAPHWHAQVEVNYIVRGWAHYCMSGHEVRFEAGDLVLFWGGLPHMLDDCSDDLIYAGGHLPLVHFFRRRLALTTRLWATRCIQAAGFSGVRPARHSTSSRR